jgi:transposase
VRTPGAAGGGAASEVEARGATLRYLRKYSPDLNPIEMPFSKLKADLRQGCRADNFNTNRRSAIDRRTTRHRGYAVSQQKRFGSRSHSAG